MAETKYTNSIASDFPSAYVNTSTLLAEIQASAIVTAIDRIDTAGDDCYIWFKDALSAGDKTILDGDTSSPAGGLISVHDNSEVDEFPLSEAGYPLVAPGFEDNEGLDPQWKGSIYLATAGAINIFDEVITTERRIRNGWYEIFDPTVVMYGDYVEFAVVDKDDVLGLFSVYGLTVGVDVLELKKYVIKDYVITGRSFRQEFQSNGTFTVMAGLYMRTIYNSKGGVDVQFKTVVQTYE